MRDKHDYLFTCILFSFVFLGAVLRFYGLTIQSYWIDELYSASVAAPGQSVGDIVRACACDAHPPLYELLLSGAYHLFGYTEWVGRALSAVFGVLGMVAVFLLARRLWNRSAALMALAVTVPMFFHVYYSQEVRSYALLFLLSVLSWYGAVGLMARGGWRPLGVYSILSLVLVYTHYFGWFVLVSQACVVTVWVACDFRQRWRVFRRFAGAGVLVLAGYAPWMGAMFSNKLLNPAATWIRPVTIGFPLDFLERYFASGYGFVLALLPVLSVLRWRARGAGRSDGPPVSPWTILAGWIGVTWFLPFFLSRFTAPMLIPRVTMVTVPAILLIPAGLAAPLPLRRAVAVSIVVLLSLTAMLVASDRYYQQTWKEDWRSTVRHIMETDPEGRIPVLAHWDYNFEAYFRMLGDGRDVIRPRVRSFVAIASRLPGDGSVWVLKAHLMHEIDQEVVDLLARYFEPVGHWEAYMSEATLWRFRTPAQREALIKDWQKLLPPRRAPERDVRPRSAEEVRKMLTARLPGDDTPFDPGDRILFIQGGWRAVFTRVGSGPVYRGEWIHRDTGKTLRDTLVVRHCSSRKIVIYRKGTDGCYRGIMVEGNAFAYGIADWFTWDGMWKMEFPNARRMAKIGTNSGERD